MSTLAEKLLDHGIRLANQNPGDHKVLCPQCSGQRRNRKDPCLSVHVDLDGQNACWMCHHCDWRGATAHDDPRPPRQERRRAPPPPREPNREVEAWFARRGIGNMVLQRANVGLDNHYLSQIGAKTPCIAFPYFRGG